MILLDKHPENLNFSIKIIKTKKQFNIFKIFILIVLKFIVFI
jgi:hypothetical protein